MEQWDAQLTPELLADRMIELVDPTAKHPQGAWGVTGSAMEQMT
jgi:hypothetical protein